MPRWTVDLGGKPACGCGTEEELAPRKREVAGSIPAVSLPHFFLFHSRKFGTALRRMDSVQNYKIVNGSYRMKYCSRACVCSSPSPPPLPPSNENGTTSLRIQNNPLFGHLGNVQWEPSSFLISCVQLNAKFVEQSFSGVKKIPHRKWIQ